MKFENYMILDFPSRSSNEAFARSAVACFAAQMDPTLEELGDIKTAVSEAVTNCIVHAYPERQHVGHRGKRPWHWHTGCGKGKTAYVHNGWRRA